MKKNKNFVPAISSHPLTSKEIHTRYKGRAKNHKLSFTEAEFSDWIKKNNVRFEDSIFWARNDLEIYGLDDLFIQRYPGQRYGGKK